MSENFQSLDLERWANFDFETATPSEKSPDSFTTDYSSSDFSQSNVSERDAKAALEDIPSLPPAYQEDLEIEVGKVPLYKRPHLKAIFFGSGVLLVCALLGAVLTQGNSIQLGNANPEAIAPDVALEEEEVDPDQAKLAELEGEIAFSSLKNRAALLEEQQKQQVLTGQLQEQSQQSEVARAPLPPMNSRTSVSSTVPSPPPRQNFIPPAPTPMRAVPPIPITPTASLPTSAPPPKQMMSFGALPENSVQSGVSWPRSAPSSSSVEETMRDDSILLVQQETSFLQGDRQFLVEGGQSLTGTVTQQLIAAEKAILHIHTTEAILGLPANSRLLAEIIQVMDGYLVAEVRAILQGDRPAILLPAGTMTVSAANGRLLQAKTDQGFLQTPLGRALLGAGRGLADQYISRSETFFQTESSTSITKAGGNKDWTSLGSAALKGLTDSLLAEPNAGSAVQLIQPNTSVQLTIHAPFVLSL